MWTHICAILGLAGLCACWILFQQWLRWLDPAAGKSADACSGCGACQRNAPVDEDGDKI